MLVYKSESWANGEKQNEKSWCAMTVADCSKRLGHWLRTRVVRVQCAYVEWRLHTSKPSAEIVAVGPTRRSRRGRRRMTDTVELKLGAWRLRVWIGCGTSPVKLTECWSNVRPTVQTQNKTCGSIQHTLKKINGRRGQTGENDVAIVETTQYKRRHQLLHGLLADLVAELPQPPEVVETSRMLFDINIS